MNAQRVLFVVNDARFFVTHRLQLAEGIRAAGYDVHVAAPAIGSAAETIREAKFPFHHIPIDRQGVNPLNDARALFALIRLYWQLKPHLVHHVTVKPVLYGTLAARISRVPAVVNAISGLGILFARDSRASTVRAAVIRVVYRVALRHPNMRVVFQNDEDRLTFLRARIIRQDSSVLIRGSGVDLTAFRPETPPDDPPIVLLPARLLRRKGVREFVEAARSVKTDGIVARFVLVGDTAQNRDAISPRELQQWREEGIVEFWGWADDMPSVVSRAAVVCLPSYYPEGVPKALLDACAGGRAIVTTDMPGCRDVVTDGVNGFLVQPRDPVSLAGAIKTLLKDPDLRLSMGRNGRVLAEKQFDIEFVIRATLDTYRSLDETIGRNTPQTPRAS